MAARVYSNFLRRKCPGLCHLFGQLDGVMANANPKGYYGLDNCDRDEWSTPSILSCSQPNHSLLGASSVFSSPAWTRVDYETRSLSIDQYCRNPAFHSWDLLEQRVCSPPYSVTQRLADLL